MCRLGVLIAGAERDDPSLTDLLTFRRERRQTVSSTGSRGIRRLCRDVQTERASRTSNQTFECELAHSSQIKSWLPLRRGRARERMMLRLRLPAALFRLAFWINSWISCG